MEQKTIKAELPSKETQDPTKDAGRVRLGGGAIHFTTPRDVTKDAGRVRFGGGAIRF